MALRRIAFGAAALSAARVFQLAASFVAVPFLARILSPADFGLAALAMSMVMFTLFIGDAGLGRSLVRTSPLDAETWSSGHWTVLLLTGGLGLMIAALAWPAALFFEEPRLRAIMLAFAIVPLLHGATEIPAASLLQREKFLWLAAADLVSALCGIVVALWLAINGAGVWALVGQNFTIYLVKAVVTVSASQYRPLYMLSFSRLGEHFRFARDTLGFSITNFISRQTDTLVIGKLLGASTLGLYNIAYRIAQLPVNVVGTSLQNALYPRLVLLRNDLPALRQIVLAATMAQAAFVFPPMAAIAASSTAFFKLLLSDRWMGAGPLYTLLVTAAAVQTVTALNGALLQSIGRTGARLRLTMEYAILWSASAIVLAHFSVEAVAIGSSLATLLYLPRLLHVYLRPIGCSLMDFVRALLAPAAVAIAIFAVHRVIVLNVKMDSWPQIGIAALETLIGYGALLWFGRRTLIEKLQTVRSIVAKESPKQAPMLEESAEAQLS